MMRSLFLFVAIFAFRFTSNGQDLKPLQNFSSLQWEGRAPLGAGPRDDGAAFSLLGMGFYMGGADFSFKLRNDLWRYDPASDTWSEMDSLPGRPRQYASVITYQDRAYVFGGILSDGTPSNEVFRFSATTNTWQQLPNGTWSPRFKAAAFRTGSEAILTLGANDTTAFRDCWTFNLASETWRQLDSLPFEARYDAVVFHALGMGYVALGQDSVQTWNDMWRYDPLDGQWSRVADYPGAARTFSCAVAEPGGALFAGGMTAEGLYTDEAYYYDARSDSWTDMPAYPVSEIRGMEGFRIENELVFAGGLTRNFTRVDNMHTMLLSTGATYPEVHVRPIPARRNAVAFVEFPAAKGASVVEIWTVLGRMVANWNVNPDAYSLELPMDAIAPGYYVLRWVNEDASTAVPFIVCD